MKILVIGASSYVGARVYFELCNEYDVLGTYYSNKLWSNLIRLDITDEQEVEKLVYKALPNIIIHIANEASAKWCAENSEKAVELNQLATGYIVNSANHIDAKIIYISSLAASQPINVYAKTKFESEELVKATKAGYLILRPSLILGFSPNITNDRPFNRLLKNLDHGTPAVYDISWKFQPTYLGHICEVIEATIRRGIWNEIIPVAVEDLKSRYDIAKDILGPYGINVKAVDNHDTSPVIKEDLYKLGQLGLPVYTYIEMIKKIIDEIKNRERFHI